jgi:hypothetical protein
MLEMASDVIGAGTALAGLVLVFLGSVSNGFEAYQPQERRSVVKKYRRRAWWSFAAFVLALGAALLGLLSKWLQLACLTGAGLALLILSFAAAVWIGFGEVREIE